MPSFDIISAAGQGYKTVWEERNYLVKLAMVPVLVKMVCYSAVVMLGWESLYLRQALIMLPSYFTEGWLLSHVLRLVFLGQRWPFRPIGNDEQDMALLRDRAFGVTAGTLTYVVIRFLLAGFVTLLHEAAPQMDVAPKDASAGVLVAGVALIVSMIWAFRFLWLYIPAALNYSMKSFILALGGYNTSLYMIGTWLVCVGPLLFGFTVLALSVIGPYGHESNVPAALTFALGFFHVAIDTVINVIATAGMAFGLKSMIGGKK